MDQGRENIGNITTHALIYLTGGSDTEMRQFCTILLEKRQAIRVELLDCHEMYLNEKGKRKSTAGQRKIMILCLVEHLDSIFRQLPRGMEMVAVPVLRHHKRSF